MAKDKKGYIKLHRVLQDNPLWMAEPFSKGQAWVDLLLSANHEDNEFILGNVIISTKRGQFFTSELKIAAKWRWSRKKVRAYLALMETLKMATTEATTKGTIITIENYEFYQSGGTTKGTAKGTLKGQRRNNEGYTNKNDKRMIKNDKEEEGEISVVFSTFEKYGFQITSGSAEDMRYLIEEYPTDWIIEAIKRSSDRGKKTLGYIKGILNNWKIAGAIDDPKKKEIKKPEKSGNAFVDIANEMKEKKDEYRTSERSFNQSIVCIPEPDKRG